MDLTILQAAATGWEFQFGVEWTNPIFYLNLAGLALALTILFKLRDLRGMTRRADAVWLAAIVFTIGTGLHFLGDLTNFPEEWDHILIHATVAVALLLFVLKGFGSDD